ncbi:hypothetical protein D9601_12620 [Sphingomonas sp. MA1305]|nr:hypothetical protein [Sphingomonas sp. MA1305]
MRRHRRHRRYRGARPLARLGLRHRQGGGLTLLIRHPRAGGDPDTQVVARAAPSAALDPRLRGDDGWSSKGIIPCPKSSSATKWTPRPRRSSASAASRSTRSPARPPTS